MSINDEDDCGDRANLCRIRWVHELEHIHRPGATDESFEHPREAWPVAFDYSDEGHDDITIWKYFRRVQDALVDGLTVVDLIHAIERNLDGSEVAYPIDYIEGRVEYEIPSGRRIEDLLRVAQCANYRLVE